MEMQRGYKHFAPNGARSSPVFLEIRPPSYTYPVNGVKSNDITYRELLILAEPPLTHVVMRSRSECYSLAAVLDDQFLVQSEIVAANSAFCGEKLARLQAGFSGGGVGGATSFFVCVRAGRDFVGDADVGRRELCYDEVRALFIRLLDVFAGVVADD